MTEIAYGSRNEVRTDQGQWNAGMNAPIEYAVYSQGEPHRYRPDVAAVKGWLPWCRGGSIFLA